jgi:hypothetical protein
MIVVAIALGFLGVVGILHHSIDHLFKRWDDER